MTQYPGPESLRFAAPGERRRSAAGDHPATATKRGGKGVRESEPSILPGKRGTVPTSPGEERDGQSTGALEGTMPETQSFEAISPRLQRIAT